MTVDHSTRYELPGGYVVTIAVYKDPEVFNLVSVGTKTRALKQYWTPLRDCKKTAKQQLKKLLDKRTKYSNAQPNKKKHE